MITDKAVEVMTRLAQEIGFSVRPDEYTWSKGAIVSAGDYKGESMVVAVFCDAARAQKWVAAMHEELECWGSDLLGEVLEFPIATNWADGFGAVAALRGIDIAHKSESGN